MECIMVPMKRQFGFSSEQTKFYEKYAMENQIDLIQLCILDFLDQSGGKATWLVLFEAMPFSRTSLQNTAMVLRDQELVVPEGDLVRLSEYAPFMIDDLLRDLHRSYQTFAGRNFIPEEDHELLA